MGIPLHALGHVDLQPDSVRIQEEDAADRSRSVTFNPTCPIFMLRTIPLTIIMNLRVLYYRILINL
ncbi:hypothetical protein B2K_40325 [Paenibacillus mucilaginosus K02]|uniref:Uncharacterized protein n=1 Tax=Paenibacillus mucilaginosus K02 TaxID=997761 RepID=R9UQ69_9BACL|nr:hypothetical protein B2K_40325 [Paenibacillus mucilaginosus K02]